MKNLVLSITIGAALASCAPTKIYSPAEVQSICEEKRAEASGVQGKVSVGANTRTGPSMGISLSVNDKFLRGLDPQAVYDQCVQKYNDMNAKAMANNGKGGQAQ